MKGKKLRLKIPVLACCALLLLASCHHKKHTTDSDNSAQTDPKENKGGKLTPFERNLQRKYAGMLAVNDEAITNFRLYGFIDEWYAVPYLYAGKTKQGIDCSGFVSALYRDVYNKTISGSSSGLGDQSSAVKRTDLREGDLVFFNISGNKISHVGVYLQNDRFVHASTKKGVIISSLNEPYYQKYFNRGGRIKGS